MLRIERDKPWLGFFFKIKFIYLFTGGKLKSEVNTVD